MAIRKFTTFALLVLFVSIAACAQTWTPLTNLSKYPNIMQMLLLRDGRVFIHRTNSPQWEFLTPDSAGSYEHGTFSPAAAMPLGYSPRAFSSGVLRSGNLLVEGGEYNDNGHEDWGNRGALYNIRADKWDSVAPPAGWLTIGDGASTLLADGTYMQANCCTKEVALFNESDRSWTPTAETLGTNNNERSFTLRWDGKVVMADSGVNPYCGNTETSTQVYDNGAWVCGSQLPERLWSYRDHEMGPAVQLYTGEILQCGGEVSGCATWEPESDVWLPTEAPHGYWMDETPTVLLPSGQVLAQTMNTDNITCQFQLYDPETRKWTFTTNPPACSKSTRMLLLPTGEVLYSNFAKQMYLYRPAFEDAVKVAVPTIFATVLGGTMRAGSANNVILGMQLNGLSGASVHDDDAQQNTFYPLARFTNATTGVVTYGFTHDDRTGSIAPGTVGYTKVDLPASMIPGTYTLQVVTNGITSNDVTIIVK